MNNKYDYYRLISGDAVWKTNNTACFYYDRKHKASSDTWFRTWMSPNWFNDYFKKCKQDGTKPEYRKLSDEEAFLLEL